MKRTRRGRDRSCMDHIAADANSHKSVLYHGHIGTPAHRRASAFASSFLREMCARGLCAVATAFAAKVKARRGPSNTRRRVYKTTFYKIDKVEVAKIRASAAVPSLERYLFTRSDDIAPYARYVRAFLIFPRCNSAYHPLPLTRSLSLSAFFQSYALRRLC